MFANHTVIGRVVAHCPDGTERVPARLRLSHLLESADFTSIEVPPQAILVVRRVASQAISLSSFRLNSDWQRELRENISRLYQRAVRPTRGIVPENAEAVLFADEGEWLACVGLAVQSRQVERAWYWRACLPSEAVSSSRTLVRLWTSTPRFVPAAVTHLAEWGCIDGVLKLFSPHEADAVFTALAGEWNLPKPEPQLKRELAELDRITINAKQPLPVERAPHGSAGPRVFSQRPSKSGKTQQSETDSSRADHYTGTHAQTQAPWKRWLPTLEKSCEALPLETQRLLSGAVALFHAPAVARSAHFAEEVGRWLFAIAQLDRSTAEPTAKTEPVVTTESSVSREAVWVPKAGSRQRSSRRGSNIRVPQMSVDYCESPGPCAKQDVADVVPRLGKVKSNEARPKSAVEKTQRRFWQDLSGCETKIGGVLFLVNLLQQTRLPECFDEDFDLSRYISGWGLAELLAKVLLGPLASDFEDDPIWTTLQLLDGRTPGEVAGASLPEVADYRMPVEWLKRFAVQDEPWLVVNSPDRLQLVHPSGAFTVVDCALGDLTVASRAASELKRYNDQGVTAELSGHRSLDEESRASFLAHMQAMAGWNDLPGSMRRWMGWTFPFLQYLLVRTLGEESKSPGALTKLLLQKRGTLYCTATHVDLVMRMDQIVVPVRLAGLDSNPGWLPDLMRVVSFHYQ